MGFNEGLNEGFNKMKIKNEDIFRALCGEEIDPTQEGRKQFFEHQSRGIVPKAPDPYYCALENGKWQFDWLRNQYIEQYLGNDWWGFSLLWDDWAGKRFVLPHLCSWYPKITLRPLPSWLGLEPMTEEERDRRWRRIYGRRLTRRLNKICIAKENNKEE